MCLAALEYRSDLKRYCLFFCILMIALQDFRRYGIQILQQVVIQITLWILALKKIFTINRVG